MHGIIWCARYDEPIEGEPTLPVSGGRFTSDEAKNPSIGA
jgi:hypothetical protein